MVVGRTEKIKLDIQCHVCFMEFLIIDHEDNDGLLGLDCLDVYVDETLLYYLKNGRFQNGLSKKQIKRIEKAATQYYYDKEKDKIFKMGRDNVSRLVPKPSNRSGIILKAHVLGHFQKDVDAIVQSCEVCKRNNFAPAKEHPAKAITINGIFDRIGIDLVFGLPVTEEGFTGIM
ncbi:hypothetical protein BpHYR1_052347 [Brachionus plicatilis]|uniref:Integrase zinc-binding domain-containing protein n=1 Tax=Brachionus plicatilis TaxID=10195 RepID=A0A3M7SBE2_BRAPC|nr:hypothetical protein BpHYR1_052347 [Brachionus plicatilis]